MTDSEFAVAITEMKGMLRVVDDRTANMYALQKDIVAQNQQQDVRLAVIEAAQKNHQEGVHRVVDATLKEHDDDIKNLKYRDLFSGGIATALSTIVNLIISTARNVQP